VTGDLLPARETAPSHEPAPPAGQASAQRAAAAIAEALAATGTRLVFGVPGGGPNLDVIGAAGEVGLRFVLAHGETAAAIMAATSADLTGAPGAVLVTRGPGLASAVNGIAHATLDRLPLIVVADTVPAGDRERVSHQRLDQDALGRLVAKATVTLGSTPDPADRSLARGGWAVGRDASRNGDGHRARHAGADLDRAEADPTTADPTTPADPTAPATTTPDPTAPATTTPDPAAPATTTPDPAAPATTTVAVTSADPTTPADPTAPATTTPDPTAPATTTVAVTSADPTTMAVTSADPTTMAVTSADPTTMAVTSADPTRQTAERAVRLALARPAGAVLVNVDADASGAVPDGDQPPTPDARDDLATLASALEVARRPIVLLGLGALGHAAAVRAALAGSGIPVLHTYRACGIVPDSAPEAAGLLTGGTMEAPLLDAADLIIGLGVDPVELIPAAWDYAAPAFLVTEYPAGSAAYFTGGTEIVASLSAATAVLAAHRAGHGWPSATGRTAKQDVIRRLGWVAVAAPGWLSPHDIVTTIRAHVPDETIATVDSGAHMLAVMPLWPVEQPQRLLISSGLATMGYALPAAIGAALCTPGVPVVAFTGDGGLGMTLMEVETAVRHQLRVIVVVFNDSALSLIKIKQRSVGQGGDEAVSYGPTSFAAAAEAMGAAADSVSDADGLAAALTAALGRDGPTLIDARVDPAGYPALLDLTRGETGRRSSRDWGGPMRQGRDV
jgi:acetolactate synthase I/II/III large subunit